MRLDRVGRFRTSYGSPSVTVDAHNATRVHVDVTIRLTLMDDLSQLTGQGQLLPSELTGEPSEDIKAATEVLRAAVSKLLADSFAAEIRKVVEAYRVLLRESPAKGLDPELLAALHRARLQKKILSDTTMIDRTKACQFLGLSGANPSPKMRREENRRKVLRFNVSGRAAYPLFQFDVEGRSIFPALGQIIALKPSGWSDFRLLHWLTRPHQDFGGKPADVLETRASAVVAALARDIEPALHG